MAVVSTLAFQVVADSSKFTAGMAATKKELRAAKAIVEQTRTPLEQYESRMNNLGKLLHKGAIDQMTYNRAVVKLRDSYNAAEAAAKRYEKSLQGASKLSKITAVAMGAVTKAAGAMGAALAALTARQFAEIDSIGDTIARLGATAEGYSVLRYATSQTGVETEALDAALTKLSIGLGRAEGGAGKAGPALEALGLSLDALADMPADEQFRMIAARIAEIESPTQRAALAVDLFGKSGAGLLNMLDAVGGGYAQLAADAEAAGVVLDESGIAKVQEADDAMQKMWQTIKGTGNQLAVELSGAVEVAAGAITKLIHSFRDLREALASTADSWTEWLYEHSGGLVSGAIDYLAGTARDGGPRPGGATPQRRNANIRAAAAAEAEGDTPRETPNEKLLRQILDSNREQVAIQGNIENSTRRSAENTAPLRDVENAD